MAHKISDIEHSGLTRQDVETFAREGHLTIDRPIFTTQELDEVQVLMNGIRDNLQEVPADFVVDLANGQGPKQIDEVLWPSRLEPRLKRTKVYSRTRQLAEVLLGGPVTLHFDHHIQKTPFSDFGTAWHQDQGFEVDTAVKGTFWIPGVDVDENNGCMWFVPRSQDLGLLHHDRFGTAGIVVRDVDESKAVSAPLHRGGLSVHRELTLHASKPNKTPNSRPAWILRFRRDDQSSVRLALKEVRSGTSSAPGLSRLTRVKHK